ncbi:MAG: carboxy terminal-processing peptidase [Bacteroidetes bacterium]|nr:carboxy terminal-processing peptidase [Bacteroidota bacterium]
MKRLPIVIMMVVAGSFLAFKTMGTSRSNKPVTKYEEILRLVGEMLKAGHFSPQKMDDQFSKKVFAKYIKQMDEEKTFYLSSDIDELKKKYETRIDDEIKGTAPVEFFQAAGNIFNTRMEQAAVIYQEILSKPFDFNVDEEANLDGDKLTAPNNEAALKERWRKKLKYMTLDRYSDLLDAREKSNGKDSAVNKSDEALEKDARDKVKKIIDRTFERYRFKFNDDDKFSLFVNSVTTTMDPHTEFFPPVDKRYFDEEMSGTFFGIGASLQYDDGNIKITSIITGSPAYKSGELKVGDIIQKVAQGKGEPVDLVGFTVQDAVKVIRGKQGTEVRLTVKRQDGSIKTITLIRDKIVQDETYARSAVVNENGKKIGYIFLPEFYADFEHSNGPRSYIDVAKEVEKLKEQKVEGIVIDLRNNGGGSLYDVVQMVGLFIEEGPVVQVKDRDGAPSVLKDKEKSVLYSGPLAVMVNELSASASEIFAAAIQDYNRGIIIGSTSTYGKGTVQRNIGLDPDNGYSNSNADLGTLKLTLQKFYRINGGATQLKGVASDIVLPDNLEYLKIREKDDPDALPWDEIKKAKYNAWNPGYDLKLVQQMSNERLANDQTFKLIKDASEWLSKENNKQYSLQLAKYRKEQQNIRATVKQLETLLKLKDTNNVASIPGDLDKWENDKAKTDRFNQWLKSLGKDIYLDQAVKVVEDMIKQQNPPKAEQTDKKAF